MEYTITEYRLDADRVATDSRTVAVCPERDDAVEIAAWYAGVPDESYGYAIEKPSAVGSLIGKRTERGQKVPR